MDKKILDLCEENLGKLEPSTLRHNLNLIHDYSLLGDSKTALAMEKNLLPKIKKVFGENSRENAEILSLMANDYEVLGNYRQSEQTLLKAIDINKKICGDESSPELVANLIALAKLTNAAPDSEITLILEKAAKNIPNDEL